VTDRDSIRKPPYREKFVVAMRGLSPLWPLVPRGSEEGPDFDRLGLGVSAERRSVEADARVQPVPAGEQRLPGRP